MLWSFGRCPCDGTDLSHHWTTVLVYTSLQRQVRYEKNLSDFGSEHKREKKKFILLYNCWFSLIFFSFLPGISAPPWWTGMCVWSIFFLVSKGTQGGTTPDFGGQIGLHCRGCFKASQASLCRGGPQSVACLLSANLRRWILSAGLTPVQLLCLMGLTPWDMVAI